MLDSVLYKKMTRGIFMTGRGCRSWEGDVQKVYGELMVEIRD